jgi:hypothetical protein
MKETSAKPALRISHIVHGRMAVKNRVHYLIDPKGKGSEHAVPESVVLKRWRKRQFPNHTFSGSRLSSTLWRAVHQAFGDNLSQWVGRSAFDIDECIKSNRVGLKTSDYLSLPSAETLHALFMTCGLDRLKTIVARHISPEHKGKSGVPDLFLFATNQTTGLPSIARFVEVKKPEEPASAVQLAEIDFLNGLGLHARVLRLIEAE